MGGDPKDSASNGEDGREALRSSNGVRSVATLVGDSAIVVGVLAVVSTVGTAFGARRGDNGGDTTGIDARRE